MGISQYALTTLAKAKTFLRVENSDIQVNAFSIYNSSADASGATVQITSTAIVLVVTGGDNNGTSILTFADTDKDTLTELLTAIEALNKGWVVNILGNGSASSSDLTVIEATGCLSIGNIQYLKMTNNYFLEELINKATDDIEKYCDRKFKSRTYTDERYDGDDTDKLFLNQYPVTAVSKLCILIRNVLRIKYSDDNSYTDAYIKVNKIDSQLELHLVSADGDSSTNLSFSTYTTLTSLATAVNNETNWEAEVSDGYGYIKSTDLLEQEYGQCLNANMWTRIADDRQFDFELYANRGMIKANSFWFPEGNRNITITYTAGYSTIPEALEEVCLSLVKYMYEQSKKDLTLKSEKLGDYGYTMKDVEESFSPEMINKLSLFKKFTVL